MSLPWVVLVACHGHPAEHSDADSAADSASTDDSSEPTDTRIFRRELERLRASIADADDRFDRLTPRLALVLFPPWLDGREPSDVVEVLHGDDDVVQRKCHECSCVV